MGNTPTTDNLVKTTTGAGYRDPVSVVAEKVEKDVGARSDTMVESEEVEWKG